MKQCNVFIIIAIRIIVIYAMFYQQIYKKQSLINNQCKWLRTPIKLDDYDDND